MYLTADCLRSITAILKDPEQKRGDKNYFPLGVVCIKIIADWRVVTVGVTISLNSVCLLSFAVKAADCFFRLLFFQRHVVAYPFADCYWSDMFICQPVLASRKLSEFCAGIYSVIRNLIYFHVILISRARKLLMAHHVTCHIQPGLRKNYLWPCFYRIIKKVFRIYLIY